MHYIQLLVQLLVGGTVYVAGVLWFFFTRERMGMQLRTVSRSACISSWAIDVTHDSPRLRTRF